MSTWYQHKITVLGNQESIGKFFNLDPKEDIHYIDSFEFLFGQKNVPGLRLGKLIEQNPNLIFLVDTTVECYSYSLWIERFDIATSTHKCINVENWNEHYTPAGIYEYNKLLLEEYSKKYPTLSVKHFAREKGYESFHVRRL